MPGALFLYKVELGQTFPEFLEGGLANGLAGDERPERSVIYNEKVMGESWEKNMHV